MFGPPEPAPREHIDAFLHDIRLRGFRTKAIVYGVATAGLAALWYLAADAVPLPLGVLVVGSVGLAAARAAWYWRELARTRPEAPWTHPDRRREEEQATVRTMAEAVRDRAYVTFALIACCALPSLLERPFGIDRAVARASIDRVAIEQGDWPRLLTGTYLHGSETHFTGNMTALLTFGAILESKTSGPRVALVYLMSALGGSALSVWLPPDVPSVGASGAIVGIIGYLFVLAGRRPHLFPRVFRRATVSVFAGLATAGALGFWYIDNAGHAGGAVAGILLGALSVDESQTWDREPEQPLLDLLGWAALVVLVVGSGYTASLLWTW